MKKTPFKRKTPLISKRTSLRSKSGLRKASKVPISRLKRKLWTIFSLYIRKRDNYICFTCDAKVEGSNAHAGHFLPKSIGGLALYFDEENVRCQCMRCNIHLGGNQWEYGNRLGWEVVEKLIKKKQLTTKWSQEDYQNKIQHYELLVSEM